MVFYCTFEPATCKTQSTLHKQRVIVDWAETCRCLQRVYMRGITWRLSLFIIIAAESFHPRWLANSLAWHSCRRHNIRNLIVWLCKFRSGSKNDSIVPKLILFRGEQAVLILTAVQTGLVFLQLSYYKMNLGMLIGTPSLEAVRKKKNKQLKSIQINTKQCYQFEKQWGRGHSTNPPFCLCLLTWGLFNVDQLSEQTFAPAVEQD